MRWRADSVAYRKCRARARRLYRDNLAVNTRDYEIMMVTGEVAHVLNQLFGFNRDAG